MEETPLSGGSMTAVVRVGDTVRRGAGPWTPTIHALLRHVRAAGFTAVPEPLGLDEQGREVLSLLPGAVGTYPLEPFMWTDAMLVADTFEAALGHLRELIGFIVSRAAAGDPAQQAVLARGDVVIYARDLTYQSREARFLA